MTLYRWLNIKTNAVGTKFGKWTQIGPSFCTRSNSGRRVRVAVVECQCGAVTVVYDSDLKMGKSTQCYPCRTRTHGLSELPEYHVWTSIIQRCNNPNNNFYGDYGGRGITVCSEWRDSFEAFLEYVGRRPSGRHEIDRYPNNDGNYEPGNVRWATSAQNKANRRNTRRTQYNGKTVTIVELSHLLSDWKYRDVLYRIQSGLTGDEIAKLPPPKRRRIAVK